MNNLVCEECGASIKVPDDVVKGEVITCPDCGTDYEVVEVRENDVIIRLAEKVGEDWGE